MLWIVLGSMLVFFFIAISLWASVQSWRDVASGSPKYESVADVTGIWNREVLESILGASDANDCYHVTPSQVRRIRRPMWKVLFDSETTDVFCLIATVVSPIVYYFQAELGQAMLILLVGYVVVGYALAAFFTMRSLGSNKVH